MWIDRVKRLLCWHRVASISSWSSIGLCGGMRIAVRCSSGHVLWYHCGIRSSAGTCGLADSPEINATSAHRMSAFRYIFKEGRAVASKHTKVLAAAASLPDMYQHSFVPGISLWRRMSTAIFQYISREGTLTIRGVCIFPILEPGPYLHLAPSLALVGVVDPSGLFSDYFANVIFELLPSRQKWCMPNWTRYNKQKVAILILPRSIEGHGG